MLYDAEDMIADLRSERLSEHCDTIGWLHIQKSLHSRTR